MNSSVNVSNQYVLQNTEDTNKLHKKMKAKAKLEKNIKHSILIGINIVIMLVILFPLIYAVCVSFLPVGQLYHAGLNFITSTPTLENYKDVLDKIPIGRFLFNSFLVAGCITFGQIISCSLAAFSFSFLEFKGKNVLFMLIMATMMIPGEATIISNYLTVSGWGWLDSYKVLIIPYITSAMGIFLFRQFFMTFPISLYEAAKLDGCRNLRFLLTILLPLTKSAIGTMVVYTFINAWNMYMWPLLVTGSNDLRTVQIGIEMLNTEDAQSLSLMISGIIMVIVPSISVFIIGQKQLIKGLFSGSVKG